MSRLNPQDEALADGFEDRLEVAGVWLNLGSEGVRFRGLIDRKERMATLQDGMLGTTPVSTVLIEVPARFITSPPIVDQFTLTDDCGNTFQLISRARDLGFKWQLMCKEAKAAQ